MKSESITRFFAALAVLVVIGAIATFVSIVSVGSGEPRLSVEVGFTSTSPIGVQGGVVVPASCPSYAHTAGACDPPSFDASCPGGGSSVNAGDSCDLTWSCVNSSSSSGVNFSTGGATSGSVPVTPSNTTTYTVVCSNGGQSSQTVTVVDPQLSITANPDRIQVNTTSTITWSADGGVASSCAVSENNPNITDGWSGASGSQTTSPLDAQTTYTLSCQTSAGTASESVTVNLIPFFQEF